MQVTVLPLSPTVLGLFSWSQLASSRDLSICLSIPIAFELTTEFFQWASYNSFYFFKILIDIFIIVPKRWVLLYNYLGSICLTIQQSYWLKPKSVWLSLRFPDGGNSFSRCSGLPLPSFIKVLSSAGHIVADFSCKMVLNPDAHK